MRPEDFVARADEVVAVEGLDIHLAVRTVVDAVEKDLCAGVVRDLGCASDVHDGTERIRGNGARDETRLGGNERFQIFDVQVAVLAHLPPENFCAIFFKRHPGGDVGLVIHVGNNNFVALTESLSDRKTNQANEGGGVHSERNFAGVACIQEIGDALARVCNCRVNLLALRIAAAALNVAF